MLALNIGLVILRAKSTVEVDCILINFRINQNIRSCF